MKLAIKGGKPVRDKYLSYGQQWIGQEDIDEVSRVLKSDYLTTGPKVEEFEREFADYLGVDYAVALSNGTAALHGGTFAAGIKEGDEVITTPMTFAASANSILYQGGRPVFADIDPSTYNIDPRDLERKISGRTRAIIPVDFTGQPVAMDEIREIANKYKLVIIEDASHSLGATYKGRKVGTLADMTTFSFHPVKHITTGEGGMVTTNNKELYEKLRLFRAHGISREREILRSKDEGPWYYEQLALGYNYRITDIQAALGMSQLGKLGKFLKRRRKIADIYNSQLKTIAGLILPHQAAYANSSWHLYVIQVELEAFKIGRKEIFQALQAENIGVNVHYIPVYYHPYYQDLGYKKGLCPKAEALYERLISLPLHPKMDDEDVGHVVEAVRKVLEYYRR